MELEKFYGTGRRKNSVARVWMQIGNGIITVNNKSIKEFFRRENAETLAVQSLAQTDTVNKFDIKINVHGGGVMGQAGAIRHGISNALLHANPNLRLVLKKAGFLTRDSRIKERKKYGQKGARKRFQFSKR
ncbi:MAG: 30S ribosomal protein S9 [Nitrospinota bacterium]